MSFLLNGGALPGPVKERVPSSARESAAQVVVAVNKLGGYCDDHERTCSMARGGVQFAGRQIQSAAQWLDKAKDKH